MTDEREEQLLDQILELREHVRTLQYQLAWEKRYNERVDKVIAGCDSCHTKTLVLTLKSIQQAFQDRETT